VGRIFHREMMLQRPASSIQLIFTSLVL
jgi:hypothetical protein